MAADERNQPQKREQDDNKKERETSSSRRRRGGRGRSRTGSGTRQQSSDQERSRKPESPAPARDSARSSGTGSSRPPRRSKSDAPVYEERKERSSLGHPTARTVDTGTQSEQSEDADQSKKSKRTARSLRSARRASRQRWRWNRTVTVFVLAALLAVVLWRTMNTSRDRDTITYSEFVSEYVTPGVEETGVSSIRVIGERLEAELSEVDERGRIQRRTVFLGPLDVTPELVEEWIGRGIAVEFKPSGSSWSMIAATLPYVVIFIIILFLFRQSQGAQRGMFGFGKSRAQEFTEDVPGVTFNDVAGVEESKQELREVVEFLRDPGKFQRLGGNIPRGVLMVGAPGTGKTYLARAVAGEARVPFFSISGSDFVEMFVGVGASRVRDLFNKAKAKAPCIVFIDEIDAVGRQRGAGLGGGHDEREQTLNQLLVEMDGFSSSTTVILIAATNRPDVLDPALLRPGRFDRQVVIDMPDVRGREGILKIHTAEVPLAADVDFHAVARGTPGLSGADLKNLVNEAALLAARRDLHAVTMAEFDLAREKVMWGIERRSLLMSESDKQTTAVHEAGHALVSLLTADADPVHKVSIIPRGRALGLTAFLPDTERHTVSGSWCRGKLVGLLGGRAAEQLVLNEVTNGAANDLETATELARRMVCNWGMSDRLGPVAIGRKNEEVFIGRDFVQTRPISERTMQTVDEEVQRLIDEAMEQARALLQKNRSALDALTRALLTQEVLERPQIEEIVRDHAGRATRVAAVPEESAKESRPRVVERPRRDDRCEERSGKPREERPEPPREKAPPEKKAPSPADASDEPDTSDRPAADTRDAKDDSESERTSRRRRRRPRSRKRKDRAADEHLEKTSDTPDKDDARKSADEQPAEKEKPPEAETVREAAAPPPRPEPGPEPVSAPKSFGRRPKVARVSALPKSKVPETGISVASVTGDSVSFGRGEKPSDDLKEQQWRLAQQENRAKGKEDGTASTSDPEHSPEQGDLKTGDQAEDNQTVTQTASEQPAPDTDANDEAEATEQDRASENNRAPDEPAPSSDETVDESAGDTEPTNDRSEGDSHTASASFGRRGGRTVRRSALTASEAPEDGVPVNAVTSGEISYGRSPRRASEPETPAPETPQSETEDGKDGAAEGEDKS